MEVMILSYLGPSVSSSHSMACLARVNTASNLTEAAQAAAHNFTHTAGRCAYHYAANLAGEPAAGWSRCLQVCQQQQLLQLCGQWERHNVLLASDLAVLAVDVQAKCQWGLTASEEAGLNSVVFAGMCVGAPVWGMVSDSYGRKTSFCLATLISAVFGFATAAAPNFHVSSSQQWKTGWFQLSC
jgi:hypothetical protein